MAVCDAVSCKKPFQSATSRKIVSHFRLESQRRFFPILAADLSTFRDGPGSHDVGCLRDASLWIDLEVTLVPKASSRRAFLSTVVRAQFRATTRHLFCRCHMCTSSTNDATRWTVGSLTELHGLAALLKRLSSCVGNA